jgi:hypothetical protein
LDRPLAYWKTFEARHSAANHRVRSGEMFDLPCPVHNPDVAQHAYRDRHGSVRIAPGERNHHTQSLRGTADPEVQMPIERDHEVIS